MAAFYPKLLFTTCCSARSYRGPVNLGLVCSHFIFCDIFGIQLDELCESNSTSAADTSGASASSVLPES